jgi:hypothetical protein
MQRDNSNGVSLFLYKLNEIPMISSSNEERDKLFKEAISESDICFKHKEYDNAFKALAKATLILSAYTGLASEAYDQGKYLLNLMAIKERQAEICLKDKRPNYESYLIFSLEAFALDIANDLVPFPHLSGFYHRKEIQYSFNPDDLGDKMELTLKEFKIYDHRKEFFDEFSKFIYVDLPLIYGIPPNFKKDTLSRVLDSLHKHFNDYEEIMKYSEDLHKKNISIIPYKIYDFVSKLIKKYYDIGNK